MLIFQQKDAEKQGRIFDFCTGRPKICEIFRSGVPSGGQKRVKKGCF